MLGLDVLSDLVLTGEVDTVVVGFTDHYGRLCGKRVDAHFFLNEVCESGTHGCDYLLTTDMEMEPVPGYRFASWDQGYGDFHVVPDLATLRRASWLDRSALVLCDVVDRDSHELAAVAPRTILRRQLDAAATQGFAAMAGTEPEYYLYRTSYRDAARSGYHDLEAAGWYLEDYQLLQGARTEGFHGEVRRHLNRSGVPVETSKGEWGLGQHELNVHYAPALESADRHVVYKQCLKEVADAQGLAVTFMAKVTAEGAGSSCHIHLSLWHTGAMGSASRDDREGGKAGGRGGEPDAGRSAHPRVHHAGLTSAFTGDVEMGPVSASNELGWFLGGCLARAPEVMPLYAPTVNSYKRYVDGSWAPTRLAWSYDNRTAGFRVVGHGDSLRIECRIPGADCNPYLAIAALLASGLDGVANQTEPPAHFEGDVYAASELSRVPATLRDAAEAFADSEFTRAAFGAEVVEHYSHFFRTEQAAYDAAVTDWERRRYFERI